jgi:basic amino acid/polyamine antiporter, APA family
MSVSETAGTGPTTASPGGASQDLYVRSATGMVRQLSLKELIPYAAYSTTPLGISLATSTFFAIVAFPRANIILDLILAMIISVPTWITFALLASSMAKVGGDYIYASRILSPVWGLFSNVSQCIGGVLAGGLYATFVAVIGIAPAFAIIGTVTGSHWWLSASDSIASKSGTFIVAAISLTILTVLAVLGTRLVTRVMAWLYGIAAVGFLVSIIAVLIRGHTGFVNHFNKFARPLTHHADNYHHTINAAVKSGLAVPSHGGYSTSSTIGALALITGGVVFSWCSIYLSAEMKGGSMRKRQLQTIIGGGMMQAIFLLLGIIVFLKVIGYDFVAAANNGNMGIGVSPYYQFFASISAPGKFLAIVLGFMSLGWFLPGIFNNLALLHRAPFAWSFDRLLPSRFADVNERTHTPVVSIIVTWVICLAAAYWATFGSSFQTALTLSFLFGYLTPLVCGVAAAVLPSRRPELFKGTPADWRIGGVQVIVIVGALCSLTTAFLLFLFLDFPRQLGLKNVAEAVSAPFAVLVLVFIWYYAAKAIQRRRGIDLDLVFRTIPPD